MTIQFGSLMICLDKNTAVQIIFENSFIFGWVPNSEERKPNLRNPYLGVLVRIVESLYSRGGTPTSGSASAYAGLGSASSSVSGYESTISPIINLILIVS
jgi:hypothetical protein